MKINTSLCILVLLILPLLGFGQQLIPDSIKHDGINREYILYVPESYSPGNAVPLVLNYHGYTASALIQVAYGDFRPIADTAGFLVVHPLGTKDIFGNTHWNVGVGNSTVDDVSFTEALIDSLSLEWNIDPKRVYSAGMSNGGFMSYKLACELNDRIAAIASVTGSMRKELSDSCSPQPPIPIMEIHGTKDPTVPYDGSEWNESIPDIMSFWVDINNCSPNPTITEIPDIDPNDGSTVEHHVYPDGVNGTRVELFKVIGGGHTWPGTELGGSTTNYDINSSVEIWKFFSRYDIEGLIVSPGTADPNVYRAGFEIYPNPAGSYVMIDNRVQQSLDYSLASKDGRIVRKGVLKSNQTRIDLNGLDAGMYLLRLGAEVHKLVVID